MIKSEMWMLKLNTRDTSVVRYQPLIDPNSSWTFVHQLRYVCQQSQLVRQNHHKSNSFWTYLHQLSYHKAMNPMKFIAFFSVKSQFSFIFLYFPWLSRFLWGTVVCQDFKYEVYGLGLVSFSSPIPFWKSMGKSENLPPNGGESKKKLGKCMKRYGKNRSENSPLRLFQRL